MITQTEPNHAEQQAQAQLESILEITAALAQADERGTEDERDEARTAIHEDALSVEARGGWHMAGNHDELQEDEEFCILLCTGGPACRLIGSLEQSEPSECRMEWQDWGTRWTEYGPANAHQDALLAYARCFYFGA